MESDDVANARCWAKDGCNDPLTPGSWKKVKVECSLCGVCTDIECRKCGAHYATTTCDGNHSPLTIEATP